MLKPLFLAISVLLAVPVVAQAAELTLIPSVKLQIGDYDNRGHYWDGREWRDRDYWERHYEKHDNGWHKRGYYDEKHHDNGKAKGHYKHNGNNNH